ncbi:hypothetical protein L2E82_44511 [Cichorium intybus]|uniref:Uncharacterized protein n=1 Tax=Cichorium intybus TaxID=13427 RepID=A0ACB8ZQB4_CICIN|nr:hypothetical protein L2E82_44511 [Cichorium intybus]
MLEKSSSLIRYCIFFFSTDDSTYLKNPTSIHNTLEDNDNGKIRSYWSTYFLDEFEIDKTEKLADYMRLALHLQEGSLCTETVDALRTGAQEMKRSVPNGKLMRRAGASSSSTSNSTSVKRGSEKRTSTMEEDPGWYSRAANFISELVVDVEMNNPKTDLPSKNEVTLHETKTIPIENGNSMETHDKDIMVEGLGLVGVYDQWVDPSVSGQRPKPRYEHAAAVIDDKMYIFGGNHNGRYLNDLLTLDLRNWTWSKVEVKPNSESPVTVTPFAGHLLIPWEGNKLISIAGHSKDPSEVINVKAFDLQTDTWVTHEDLWKTTDMHTY